MKILIGFYNAEQYIERCIVSVKMQSFKDWICYITHDLSTDNSVSIVKELIKNDSRFILMPDNDKKIYQVGNFDKIIRYNSNVDDNDIIVEVDGDDYLPDVNVFERIYKLYQDQNVWIANGSFLYHFTGQFGISLPQTDFENLRSVKYTASHIRTWKAFLWRAIKEEDLRDVNGNYQQWCGDLYFMIPMLEMAGQKHYRYMKEINYIYNEFNPNNEHKINKNINSYAVMIGSKQKYNLLER